MADKNDNFMQHEGVEVGYFNKRRQKFDQAIEDGFNATQAKPARASKPKASPKPKAAPADKPKPKAKAKADAGGSGGKYDKLPEGLRKYREAQDKKGKK